MALFPVYWMVLTAFRQGERHQVADAVVPADERARSTTSGGCFERDYFWTSMRNSAMVTAVVVVLALVVAFLAAVALARFRFRGRMAFLVTGS